MTPLPDNNAAVLLAGGSGSRMRGAVADKCLAPLAGGDCALVRCVRTFLAAGVVRHIVLVCRDSAQRAQIHSLLRALANPPPVPVPLPAPPEPVRFLCAGGGSERQFSVLNGLEACPADTGLVFIHDAARPLVTPENLRALADAADAAGGAVLAHRVKDTIKRAVFRATGDAAVAVAAGAFTVPDRLDDLERSTLWAMETPQVFRHAIALDAMRKAAADGTRVTDDVAAVVRAGHRVALVENPSPNPKVTDPSDLALLEFLLARG